jgi:pimeloyl-ACP methyl ester carboxylesterase
MLLWADPFLEQGIAVMTVDWPGTGEATHLALTADCDDVTDGLLDYAYDQPDLDSEAIVLLGFSLGGSVAIRAAALDWNVRDLHDVVFASTAYDDDTRADQARTLTGTDWAQPAIGCMSLSLLAMLNEIGLEADCCGGHSFGEVTALAAAGVLSETDAIRVARRRGELMRDAARTPGSMVAVPLSHVQMKDKLGVWGIDVVVANHNGPGQVVLSGTTADIEAVEKKLAGDGVRGAGPPGHLHRRY